LQILGKKSTAFWNLIDIYVTASPGLVCISIRLGGDEIKGFTTGAINGPYLANVCLRVYCTRRRLAGGYHKKVIIVHSTLKHADIARKVRQKRKNQGAAVGRFSVS